MLKGNRNAAKVALGADRECTVCGVLKPATAFYRGIGLRCYECRRTAVPERGRLRKIQAIVARGGRCMDCNTDLLEHPEIADFDHRPGAGRTTKTPSRLARRNREQFESELELCDLVCANCHRKRTYSRSQAHYRTSASTKANGG